MMKRLSAAEFLGCLIATIEKRTGISCYDNADNKPSPLYSVQLLRTEPANTKTMFIDRYEVSIHCISEEVEPYSNAPVLRLVQQLEEAMTDDLKLKVPYLLHRQDYLGLQALKKDPSGEGHAVLNFTFHICYGYRCK